MKRLLKLALAMICTGVFAANPALPGDSVYGLVLPLTDQHAAKVNLAALAGRPALITMFYGNCKLSCPVTFHAMTATVAALSDAERAKLAAVLISLDPPNDKPAVLASLAHEHGMDGSMWQLLVSDNDFHTRTLAAALGIRYRRLGSGEINHSSRIVLTDSQGRIIASTENVGPMPDPALLDALHQQLR
jgi:protein SCO1/2